MAFDTIEELLKTKTPPANQQKPPDPNAPTDPNAPKDPNAPDAELDPDDPNNPYKIKPFGDNPVDPLTGHPIFGTGKGSGSSFGALGDQHSGHKAIILKHSYADGRVKIYEDARGIAERTEMTLPEGKVVVYKDYTYPGSPVRYKRIDVLSIDDELRGSLSLYPREKTNPNPVYRIFFDRAEIGTGNGDIALFIAQKLVSHVIQTREGVGAWVDGEVISTINKILEDKR